MNKLEEVMCNMNYSYEDMPSEGRLQKEVSKRLPGYEIEVWDMDDWNTNLTGSVVNHIADEVNKGKKEILYAEWWTNDIKAFFAIVALK